MSASPLRASAPAKINLGLWVTGKRNDGYHDLLTVFQAVNLEDHLTAEAAPEGILRLALPRGGAPAGEDNLVLRAARRLWHRIGRRPGVSLTLEKHIPQGAGLGGGSSDAATALRLLDRLWGLGLSADALAHVALELGSDVPFFLHGGTAIGEGRGERLTPLRLPATPWGWVLALPRVVVSTPKIFAGLPAPLPPVAVKPEALRAMIEKGDLARLGAVLENQLEPVACGLEPALAALGAALRRAAPPGALVAMSGSGSAYFMVTPTREQAKAVVDEGLALGGRAADTGLENVALRFCTPVPPIYSDQGGS